jgi:hypothetical protein
MVIKETLRFAAIRSKRALFSGERNIYCYATVDKNKAAETLRRHDPEWNSLVGQVGEFEVVPAQNQLELHYP